MKQELHTLLNKCCLLAILECRDKFSAQKAKYSQVPLYLSSASVQVSI